MEIYTKKGDKGFTSTVEGEKVSKTDILLEVQGKVDEVNAGIGHLRSVIVDDLDVEEKKEIDEDLKKIQYKLYKIGTDISSKFKQKNITEEDVKFLEDKIDFFQNKSGKLENFIYYSGSKSVTYTHVVRSLTRTAERTFARLVEDVETPYDYKFVNRLSDFMYALGRYIKHLNGENDEIVK
ncbi:MAG: cob(I)yrinic acid a,c-diamide adenosyltransferase [Eubacteriales bacterium]